MTEIAAHHGPLRDTCLYIDDTGGSGRPVVLAHAWPLSGESWSPQVSSLHKAGYRVITYDRRGFGHSGKPGTGYTYDTLTEDLHTLVEMLDLDRATLVGHSMGGGEVAHYLSRYGCERVHSAVFAATVTPYMLQTADNPDGPLPEDIATRLAADLTRDQDSFYEQYITEFFTADEEMTVGEAQRQQALSWCRQASKQASMECFIAWSSTDFRDDLAQVSVPCLVIHGDADTSAPYAGSGLRTHQAIAGSELRVISGGPHGCNLSHPSQFNDALLDFLARMETPR